MCSLWNRLSAKCLVLQRMDLCKNCTFFTSCFVSGDPSRGRASRVGPEPDGGGREEAGTVNHDDCFLSQTFMVRCSPQTAKEARMLASHSKPSSLSSRLNSTTVVLQIFDQDYARMLFRIFGYSVVRENRFQEYHWAMSFRLKCYKILWFDSYCRSSDTLQTDICQTVCSVWQLFDDIQCVWQSFEDTQCKTKK